MPKEEVASEGQSPNVTFVGGKAIEQTETLESDRPADELAAAKAAVKKAIAEAAEKAGNEAASQAKEGKAKDPYKPPGAKTEVERGPDGKFLPRDGAKPSESAAKDEKAAKEKPEGSGEADKEDDEELDLGKATVKQLFKAREKAAQIKKAASDEASKAMAELRRQQEEFQRQVQAFQQSQAQIQREREALANLKKDPARAIREVGWDPEQFILDLAQEGTPEGQAKRQQQELQRQLDELKSWKEEQAKAHQKAMEEAYVRQHEIHRRTVVDNFIKMALNEEKYPHVSTFYKGREKHLVAAGDLTAEEFRNLSGGREADLSDILDYLEDELAQSAKAWYTRRNNDSSKTEQEPVETSSPKKPVAKDKGKSLNPGLSSERRSSGGNVNLKDLDAEERHEAAKLAVKAALAAASKNH
jgi:hypothetical protein